ncbi:MAG: hypothetical protein II064_02225, partial [Bacteroidales bacterium]|nr:hypothetical protein [Bacteroidales bacterium]
MAKVDSLEIISKGFEKLGKYSYFYKVFRNKAPDNTLKPDPDRIFISQPYERTGQRGHFHPADPPGG